MDLSAILPMLVLNVNAAADNVSQTVPLEKAMPGLLAKRQLQE